MIRIVGVQRSEFPSEEFILLQNQGGLRIQLRGHLVMSQSALEIADLNSTAHAFCDDALIPPGMYVILRSGEGTPRWSRTKDGGLIYHAFMNRTRSIWENHPGTLYVLSTQHTYSEPKPALLLK